MSVERRTAYLEERCADDAEVRAKVQRMLAHAETHELEDTRSTGGSSFLEMPALGPGFHVTPASEVDRRLEEDFQKAGRFRLMGRIGEGGFGSVYRAEQLEPVRRMVAIKVIKPGMDTRSVIARFEAERQTLARMHHPGIATVFDAGVTESGRPYFAMELAEGEPINAYCDAQRLDVRGRVELFLRVCSAVQHAHQKGIIHRDLKPSNVLVTTGAGEATPKVIDFGIARATGADTSGRGVTAEHGQLVGTPEYMSPEQTAGEGDIDTRADIYSMGVLLYELVSGATPFDRSAAGMGDVARILELVRSSDPPTPSTRLKAIGPRAEEVAQRRRTEVAALRRMLRGDLDWIVMKAIEKERSRRYQTINALAEDLGRYLRDEPVLARPPTSGYRLRKFARRNRVPLTAGSTIAVALICGVVGITVGLMRARQEAETARVESAIARAVTEFLTVDLLSAATPEGLGNDVTVRTVVDEATSRIEGRFPGDPLIEAGVRLAIGETYMALGLLDEAEKQLPQVLEVRSRVLGADHPDTIGAILSLAQLRVAQRRLGEAETMFVDILDRSRRVLGNQHRNTFSVMHRLAHTCGLRGRAADAERLYRELITEQSAAFGADHKDVLAARSNLIRLLQTAGRMEESAELLAQTLATQERTLGPDHAHTLYTRGSMALLHFQTGRYTDSEAEYQNVLDGMKRTFGPQHPHTLYVTGDFAMVYEAQNRSAEAEAMRLAVVDGLSKALGADHAETTIAREHLGDLYFRQQQWARAEPLYVESLAANTHEFGATHEYTRKSQLRLARTVLKLGRPEEAERLLLPLVSFASSQNLPALREYEVVYGTTLTRLSRFAEAERVLLKVADHEEPAGPRADRDRRDAIEALMTLYEGTGRAGDAQAMRTRLRDSSPPPAAAAPKTLPE